MKSFQEIFAAQKALFASGATRSYGWRINQLDRMARLVAENEQELQRAIAADFKTAPQEYVFETAATLGEVMFQKSQLADWMKPTDVPIPKFLAETGHKGVIHRDPYGVSLVVAPFNGPLLLSLRPAIAAIAAGNTCVLKLSEQLPETTGLLIDLVPKYFEASSVAAVRGNREEVTALLALPFDFIFFTGSTTVGKIVLRAAAENLTPVILELGGQNPAVVDASADIVDAARKIAWGATAWGGQWCTSPGYAYVHESVADEFVAETKKALVEFYGENPARNADYSRIVSEKDAARLAALIDPAKVAHGGQFNPAERYIAPTVLFPTTWDDEIMEEEIFGPILPVLTFRSLDEALAMIGEAPSPLAAYIFSRDQTAIDRFVNELSFGGGAVNQTNIHLFVATMPFGGTGASGMGHYYGKFGFDQLTHAKSMLIAPAGVDVPHLYPPYTDDKIQYLVKWQEY